MWHGTWGRSCGVRYQEKIARAQCNRDAAISNKTNILVIRAAVRDASQPRDTTVIDDRRPQLVA